MELSEILYEKREGVSYITLNRPEIYNALSTEMVGELHGLDELVPSWDGRIS